MTLETHASLDRHLSIKDIARGIANDWNPSAEACAEAERIVANVERMRTEPAVSAPLGLAADKDFYGHSTDTSRSLRGPRPNASLPARSMAKIP